ncbi:hypothetical protein GCM10009565_83470 [Amycolatopsis albidoflavus]
MFPQLSWLDPGERTSLWPRNPATEAGLQSVRGPPRESDSLKESFTGFKAWSHGDKSGISVLLASFADGQRAGVARLRYLALTLIP